jgi:hypothetical protein
MHLDKRSVVKLFTPLEGDMEDMENTPDYTPDFQIGSAR